MATFRTKPFNFTWVIHFNRLAKSNYGGPRLLVVNIIGNYCCMRVLLYAKILKKTENKETRLFVTFLLLVAFRFWGTRAPCPPSYAYDGNFDAIHDFKILCGFCACLPLCASQSDTDGSILYHHAKYVILLVKVKIVLNSSCNVHNFNFFIIFN